MNVITVTVTHSRPSGDHSVWLQVEGNPHFHEDVSNEAHDLQSQHILTNVISHLENVRPPLVHGGRLQGALSHQLVCIGRGEVVSCVCVCVCVDACTRFYA